MWEEASLSPLKIHSLALGTVLRDNNSGFIIQAKRELLFRREKAMKQIDNRQKQQIQMRAEKTRINKSVLSVKGGDKTGEALHFQGGAQDSGKTEAKIEPGVPYRAEHHAGRNEPCPCGSGKKFKKCCLLKPPEGR